MSRGFVFVFVQKPVQWAAPGSPEAVFPIFLADSASSGDDDDSALSGDDDDSPW